MLVATPGGSVGAALRNVDRTASQQPDARNPNRHDIESSQTGPRDPISDSICGHEYVNQHIAYALMAPHEVRAGYLAVRYDFHSVTIFRSLCNFDLCIGQPRGLGGMGPASFATVTSTHLQ